MIAADAPQIQLSSGAYFDFIAPDFSEIEIDDIAHALSHLCRYTGHCRRLYTVAQHCVLVSRVVPQEDALTGLMHDAAEAFINDLSTPLKRLLPDYAEIEGRVEAALATRFGLKMPFPPSVKEADLRLCATEKRDLLPRGPSWASLKGVRPLNRAIDPWSPRKAKFKFLNRYYELGGE